jgi:hypothetical protein
MRWRKLMHDAESSGTPWSRQSGKSLQPVPIRRMVRKSAAWFAGQPEARPRSRAMRVNPQAPAAGAKQELSDADRARIDARLARFGVAEEFAQAGLVVGEDYRKVSQLYEQLSAQAGSRGEAMPAMDVWLRQRAQERLAQGYLPTIPDGRRG